MSDLDTVQEYTPENLHAIAGEISKLRIDLLCRVDDAGSDPESEQFYLLALSALEQAYRYMSIAAIKQSQGIAQ